MSPARVLGADQGDGPAEAGERVVLELLREPLDDRFTLAPNLQILHPGGRVDDVDILVVGPYGVVAIEVKNLAGDVMISEREMYVSGDRRRNPYVLTNEKARRIKTRLSKDPRARDVWVSVLVVFAKEPRSLTIPEDQRPYFRMAREAADALLDRDLWKGRELSEEGREAILRELEVVGRPRPAKLRLGPYQLERLLTETDTVRRYSAVHSVLGTEHEVTHLAYDPARFNEASVRPALVAAFNEAQTLIEAGPHRGIRAATDLFENDDGSLTMVLPPPTGPTLRDLLDHSGPPEPDLAESIVADLVSAVHHLHTGGVAHRRLCPSFIEVDPDGRAVISGFGFARVPGSQGRTRHLSLGVGQADLDFIAPEIFVTGTADAAADIFGIGKVASALGVERLNGHELAGLVADDPNDRTPSLEILLGADDPERTGPPALHATGIHLEELLSQRPTRSVHRGTNVVTGETVIVRLYSGADALASATRSHEALMACTDLGIERARTLIQTESGLALITRHVPGPSLARALDTGEHLEDPVRLVVGIADTLDALHRSGWAHGDVTPSNIVLGSDGPVLIDFDLATSCTELPPGGTLAYRPAPGWLRARTASDLDLYGLGMVAHEILAGWRPESDADGLKIADEEPWVEAIGAALGLEGYPECETPRDFVELLHIGGLGQAPQGAHSDWVASADALYERIEELILAGRLEEATQLCPPDWARMRERIVRARGYRTALTDPGGRDLVELQDFRIEPGGVTFRFADGRSGSDPARIELFHVASAGFAAELEIRTFDDGAVEARCSQVGDGPAGSEELLRVPPLKAMPEGPGRYEITPRPRTDESGEPSTVAALRETLRRYLPGPTEDGTIRVVDQGTPTSDAIIRMTTRGDDTSALLASIFTALHVIPAMASGTHAAASGQSPLLAPYPEPLSLPAEDPLTSDVPTTDRRIASLVDREGPMNMRRLLAVFRDATTGGTAGTHRAVLMKSLERLRSEGAIELQGAVADDETLVKTPEQAWVAPRERGDRTLSEVPLSELAATVELWATTEPELEGQELLAAFLVDAYSLEATPVSLRRMETAIRGAAAELSGQVSTDYPRLAAHLASTNGRTLAMDLAEIERIVSWLPPSAFRERAWWHNDPSTIQARTWLDAGWRVTSINIRTQRVRFSR